MSTPALAPATSAGELELAHDHLPGDAHRHPTPFFYVVIAIILCIITGLEIGLSYLEGDLSDAIIVPGLIVMAIAKFVLVAAFYMHLKPDQPIFRRFFILGIGAAMILYLVVLLTLHGVY